MSEWKKVKLGDCCEITSSKRIFLSDYVPVGIPFYRSKEIAEMQKGESISDPLFISNDKYEEIKCKFGIPQKGDLLLTAIGATLGIPFVIKNNLPFYFKDGNLIWFKNFNDLLDSSFLYTWMCSSFGYQSMQNIAIGSAQKALTISALKDLSLIVPPIDIQHRIATILSRYDSLIENYQKQIKLLEEAAQRLYKEWFVDLHFPGHENTKIVDGVPEGWEKKKLIEFGCTLESGSRPKGGVDSNLKDGIPSVGAENVIGLGKYNYSSEKLITNQFYSQMRKGKIKNRDILIYKDGVYIGRTSLFQDGFPHKEMAVNEHVFLLHTLNENYQYYVFFTLYQKQYFEKMQKLNKNAAQPGLNQKALLDLGMLCPSEEFVMTFRKAIEPLMKALFNKANQIRLLTEARDRLLPKLMNGEIEV